MKWRGTPRPRNILILVLVQKLITVLRPCYIKYDKKLLVWFIQDRDFSDFDIKKKRKTGQNRDYDWIIVQQTSPTNLLNKDIFHEVHGRRKKRMCHTTRWVYWRVSSLSLSTHPQLVQQIT